jgi:hypothetical protein
VSNLTRDTGFNDRFLRPSKQVLERCHDYTTISSLQTLSNPTLLNTTAVKRREIDEIPTCQSRLTEEYLCICIVCNVKSTE